MKQTIKVDEERRNELQKCSIEVDARKELIAHMVESGRSLSDSTFKKIEDEYIKFYTEYQTAKSKFEKEVIRPAFEGKILTSWNLDFNECEATVEYED